MVFRWSLRHLILGQSSLTWYFKAFPNESNVYNHCYILMQCVLSTIISDFRVVIVRQTATEWRYLLWSTTHGFTLDSLSFLRARVTHVFLLELWVRNGLFVLRHYKRGNKLLHNLLRQALSSYSARSSSLIGARKGQTFMLLRGWTPISLDYRLLRWNNRLDQYVSLLIQYVRTIQSERFW